MTHPDDPPAPRPVQQVMVPWGQSGTDREIAYVEAVASADGASMFMRVAISVVRPGYPAEPYFTVSENRFASAASASRGSRGSPRCRHSV